MIRQRFCSFPRICTFFVFFFCKKQWRLTLVSEAEGIGPDEVCWLPSQDWFKSASIACMSLICRMVLNLEVRLVPWHVCFCRFSAAWYLQYWENAGLKDTVDLRKLYRKILCMDAQSMTVISSVLLNPSQCLLAISSVWRQLLATVPFNVKNEQEGSHGCFEGVNECWPEQTRETGPWKPYLAKTAETFGWQNSEEKSMQDRTVASSKKADNASRACVCVHGSWQLTRLLKP